MSLPVPFLKQLDGGFSPGQIINICGTASDADGFFISLMSGSQVGSGNLALHIKFQGSVATFNSFSDGKWGVAFNAKIHENVTNGLKFDVRIRAFDDKFEIFYNRKLLTEFEHREALQSVNHVYVEGFIELHNVNFGGKFYPIPYSASVHGKLDVGHKLLLSGIPLDKQDSFSINLLSNTGDLLLTFSPRFSENCVVRNAKLEGIWGTEEREGRMPFRKNEIFDVIISNEPYGFEISVNGERFCGFAHRADPTNIYTVELVGAVKIQGLSAN